MIPRLYKGKKSSVLSALTFNDAALWGADMFVGVVFALYITQNIEGGTAIHVGFAFGIYRILRSISAIPIGRFLDAHKGHIDEYYTLLAAGIVVGLTYFGLFFATELWQVYIGMALIGFGHALDIGSWKVLFYGNIPKNTGGEIIGVYETFMQIVYALSIVIAGFVGETFGFEWTLFFAGLLALSSSMIMFLVGGQTKENM